MNFEIKPFQPEHFRLVAEWEHGFQPDADWPAYIAEITAPKWIHLGLFLDSMVAGRVSFERMPYDIARVHVVTRRRAFHPDYLAYVLREIARVVLEDAQAIEAVIKPENRAVALLALRVGMRRQDIFPWQKRFILTRSDLYGSAEASEH